MKKLFLAIILLLSTMSHLIADDISEFEISGISIGDSLIQHYDQGQIETNVANKIIYPDSQFAAITMPVKSENFEFLQVVYKDQDPKYKLLSIAGRIAFDNNILGCKKQMEEILRDLKIRFKDLKYVKEDTPYTFDKSGKSLTYGYVFYLDEGAIDLYCTDLGDEFKKITGHEDELRLTIHSQEMREYLVKQFNK
tara:strand:+ start:552 stop:1136 length:585 start_codon:yes stop_codon:yes gene_type:complete